MQYGEEELKAFIIPSIIGILGFGEKGELIGKRLFPRDPKEIAKRLKRINSGEIIPEMKDLISELKNKGYETFIFEDLDLAENIREKLRVSSEVEPQSEIGRSLRKKLGEYAVEFDFLKSTLDLPRLIHEVSMEISRTSVKEAAERRDFLIIQAVEALDDLDKTLNLFAGRIREWYGLHFPELTHLISKHELYARLVHKLGRRGNFLNENLEVFDLPKDKVKEIVRAAQTSMGADLNGQDLEQIRMLCSQYLSLSETRRKIERYLSEMMKEEAPNISALTGPILGARLIALAGGLENLAKMPSSTIQVLGAEKALFRSLTTGARPPKHGVLFQHALVHGSKRSLRGKISRLLAGKIAIAARTDVFSGNYIGDELKKALLEKVEEIRKRGSRRKVSRKKRRGKRR
ncbi:C/D box methylation guide ribonucleoprotein complex aNOP56 subunit [Candidatus Bathyarchaeota archaeon]|nr:MAG: C/D box methylation guide ribonucleoprotein complex aNOP56 subunit [Candidatus Bathyarchaeota archaeon]